ncbi:MAG: signal recognition particle-docking protein FtsY [Lachnospiraceae bacterium]|nr:signal recognition particle-docking protein FtsY [Lachnospiraceae bacterium]
MAEKKGFFARLFAGLTKTRETFVKSIDRVFQGFTNIDEDFYDELEEILISGDIGVQTTEDILENLRSEVKKQHITEPIDCKDILIMSMIDKIYIGDAAYRYENETSVVFVIGVNGVGKTTTIGKLASKLKGMRKRVLVAAADTFRAAAGGQLETWTKRAGVQLVAGAEGSDPAAVVYDAVAAAKARHADVLLVDTAGRLHNKKNLMKELEKMNRIVDREFPEAYRETLVVLDATTGQNALNQAKEFSEVCDVTGIVLTKMDGTAKGGIAIAIQSQLGIPVKYIGVGESIDDLQKFNAMSFIEALFDVKMNEKGEFDAR